MELQSFKHIYWKFHDSSAFCRITLKIYICRSHLHGERCGDKFNSIWQCFPQSQQRSMDQDEEQWQLLGGMDKQRLQDLAGIGVNFTAETGRKVETGSTPAKSWSGAAGSCSRRRLFEDQTSAIHKTATTLDRLLLILFCGIPQTTLRQFWLEFARFELHVLIFAMADGKKKSSCWSF